MKKKYLFFASALIASGICLYGCGEAKTNDNTVVEQTEIVDVQNQVEDEDVVSTGDFASKNYEYNHVFDDIINEAPIIDIDFLQMTSKEQILQKYGDMPYSANGKKIECEIEDKVLVIMDADESEENMNEYFYSRYDMFELDQYIFNENKCFIDDTFTEDSCDYLSISGGEYDKYLKRNTDRYIDYPEGSNSKYLVVGHTYSELVDVFKNKGSLFALDENKIVVVWIYKDSESLNPDYVYFSFDPVSQECIEVGY